MNLLNLRYFLKRSTVFIIILSLFTAALSFGFYQLYRGGNTYNATIFVNLGVKEKNGLSQGNSSAYDLVQAADAFSETVQGWFKNPEFTSRIKNSLSAGIDVSAKKQEKQNLVITFKAPDETFAKKAAQSIRDNLQQEIGTYNLATNSSFQIAIYNAEFRTESSSVKYLILIIGLILGLMISMLLKLFVEKYLNAVTYIEQAEDILGKAADIIDSQKPDSVHFLKKIFAHHGENKPLIIGLNFNPEQLIKNLEKLSGDLKCQAMELPGDIDPGLFRHHKFIYVIVKLGTSRIDALEKIKVLAGPAIVPILQA